jgi:cytochrome c oxidase assembly factor CtaG
MGAAVLILPAIAAAHAGEPLQPDDLWSAWEFDPGVVIPLVISAALYAIGSRRHYGLTTVQRFCFWAGWLSLVVALISPLHPMGEVLFSAHMVQHEVLMLVAAPLLVVSRPLVTFLWALPFEWRRTLGRWSKTDVICQPWLWFTTPFVAWWVHAAAIWVWHAPPLFQATVSNDLVHTAQHLSFFLSALLFWWALFYAHGRRAYGGGVLYIFTTAVHTGILGALLTFAPRLWYPVYSNTTQPWGLSPLQDQQIGGLIMWVPASLVYLAAGLALFAAWMKESDALMQGVYRAK